MDELADAVYSRWTDASLDTSIASLYPGGDERSSTRNTGGSPEGATLPRAEYRIMIPPPQVKTRNSRVMQAMVVITVWSSTAETRDQYLGTIWDEYVNSDAAGTNPLATATGSVLEVDDGGQIALKEDDAVYMGRQTLLIRHRVLNATPA
jgi:hypothetical protein